MKIIEVARDADTIKHFIPGERVHSIVKDWDIVRKMKKTVGAKESCGLHKYRRQQNKTVTLEHLQQVIKEVKEIELILGDCDV